jgi:hypothetical protein
MDVSIEEIKNVLKILKPNKSPRENGIISCINLGKTT